MRKRSRIAHSKEDLGGLCSSKLGNTQLKGPASHCRWKPLGPDISTFPAFSCRPAVKGEVDRIAQFIAFCACLGLLTFDSEFEAIEQRTRLTDRFCKDDNLVLTRHGGIFL